LFGRQQSPAPFLLSGQVLDRSGFEEKHGALDFRLSRDKYSVIQKNKKIRRRQSNWLNKTTKNSEDLLTQLKELPLLKAVIISKRTGVVITASGENRMLYSIHYNLGYCISSYSLRGYTRQYKRTERRSKKIWYII
jgi:hypothetical protein